MSRVFYINARKLVQLEQIEVEADSEDEAANEYLRMAQRGDIAISSFGWHDLDRADLDIEDHGPGEDAPF